MPEALTKQCLVRSRVSFNLLKWLLITPFSSFQKEDQATQIARQQMILNNSPHELSKIRNLREMPFPVKRLQHKLPDIPLPSAKYMFRSPYRVGRVDEACQTMESSFEGFTPVSTPRLLEGTFSEDSEALRFEMSSPESVLLPRDADFGYEVITDKQQGEDGDDETSSVSVADHYKGTPPLKAKKKRVPSSMHKSSEKHSQVCPLRLR